MRNQIQVSISNRNEQEANSKVLKHFQYAFTSHELRAIEKLLHPQGVFFGKYSKMKAMGKFYTIFFGEDGIENLFHLSYSKGWSLHPFPGSEVLEIRCSDQNPFEGDVDIKNFGEPADHKISEQVFRFCFQFKDGMIYRLANSIQFLPQGEGVLEDN
jgi:hypothetical protein